ncbi:MAG: ubiquitin-like protein Pup [Gammaproteobacteria bacterium]|nr:ubiquitin-like protein Pup [Gammaproteobacteria bacterium]
MKENIRKAHREPDTAGQTDVASAPVVHTDEIDDLLGEIDEVLEENAEEFVKNYVQKGGE